MFFISLDYLKLIFMVIIFLSMGGMPPFLGVFPKIMLIQNMIMNEMFYICFILLISALLITFFYLRVVFTGLMIYSTSVKYISYSLNWLFYLFGIVSLFGLLFILMLTFYF